MPQYGSWLTVQVLTTRRNLRTLQNKTAKNDFSAKFCRFFNPFQA
ncbi:hypothetical protein HMPREF0494_0332 [Limosilactobacillus antri DSM 16041]|uniref:Uncharacterized protein n=1 Tax=Limosilactobacillus antri DSM 16041 TaxID=525309 RepID=C8P4T8_9LACO|nr:hypothetical protein HMPREF0494_0332 [Limosilactobacillus antri DSM 16041]